MQSTEIARDSEVVARINGVASKISTFSLLFGLKLGELILRHTDNLNKTLQNKEFSASECQELVRLVIKALETLRNEDSFNLFGKSGEG